MPADQFTSWPDERLLDLLFSGEDRLPLGLAMEIGNRDSMLPYLSHVVMEKQSWLAELPEWWAVVHATFILGHRGGDEVVTPLLAALRWADAYDCDWVSEVLPSIMGRVGPAMLPGLTAVVRDSTAGWSARDLALKGLAAITLINPDSTEHVFRIIGERLMDEGEDRVVRHMAGQILIDFRRQDYRMALLKLAREEWGGNFDLWPPFAFTADDVEWAFRQNKPETWHYRDDWMRFYDPAEIQRRQKRWSREYLTSQGRQGPQAKGGQLLSLPRRDQSRPPVDMPQDFDPEDNSDQ
jgi:hypothetical protein